MLKESTVWGCRGWFNILHTLTDRPLAQTDTLSRLLSMLVLWISQILWLAAKLIKGGVMHWPFGNTGKSICTHTHTVGQLSLILCLLLAQDGIICVCVFVSYQSTSSDRWRRWVYSHDLHPYGKLGLRVCLWERTTEREREMRETWREKDERETEREKKAVGTDWGPDGCVKQRQEIEVTPGGRYSWGWTLWQSSHMHNLA